MNCLMSCNFHQWALRVLRSLYFGLPQTRARIYLVGNRKHYGCRGTWPRVQTKAPKLADIYDVEHPNELDVEQTTGTAAHNVERSLKSIYASGLQPSEHDFMVDIGAGRGRFLRHDALPTITKSRGGSLAYYFTRFSSRITLEGLMKAQGFDIRPIKYASLSPSKSGAMIGNAMSMNVVKAVFLSNLRGMKIIDWSS